MGGAAMEAAADGSAEATETGGPPWMGGSIGSPSVDAVCEPGDALAASADVVDEAAVTEVGPVPAAAAAEAWWC